VLNDEIINRRTIVNKESVLINKVRHSNFLEVVLGNNRKLFPKIDVYILFKTLALIAVSKSKLTLKVIGAKLLVPLIFIGRVSYCNR
jgi:hypothetical protein